MPRLIANQGFRSAIDRNTPHPMSVPLLRVVDITAIARLKRLEAAVPGDLSSLPASGRNLPDLFAPASVGHEIEPAPIMGPIWLGLRGRFARHPHGRTALGSHKVNVGVVAYDRVKGDPATIGRPTRRAGDSRSEVGQL